MAPRSSILPALQELGVPTPDGRSDVALTLSADDPAYDPTFIADESPSLSPPSEGAEVVHGQNLAELIASQDGGEDYLRGMASELAQNFELDKQSRADWDDIAKKAVELLGFKIETMSEPFPNACGASHPVLAQAVVKMQAKTISQLFPPGGPVKTIVKGTETPERAAQAKRVRDYMNYQATVQMEEFRPELEKLLFHALLFGMGFKKLYYDATLGRPVARMVTADSFVIDYYATDLQSAERYTHVIQMNHNDILRYQLADLFRRGDPGEPSQPEISTTKELVDSQHGSAQPTLAKNQHTILEMHCNWNIDFAGQADPDGLELPYIISMDKDTNHIYSIRRNWREGDEKKLKIVHFVPYCMIPGLGFYGYGYLHLIGGLSKTATSSMRQLIDAAISLTFL